MSDFEDALDPERINDLEFEDFKDPVYDQSFRDFGDDSYK